MWFVTFFMIAAVFGNPEGWCNISHLMYFYYFTSFKKKRNGLLFSIFLVLTAVCLPDYLFQYLNFIKLGISCSLSCRFCCYINTYDFPRSRIAKGNKLQNGAMHENSLHKMEQASHFIHCKKMNIRYFRPLILNHTITTTNNHSWSR